MMVVLPGCRSKKPSEDGDKVSMLISSAKNYTWKLSDLAWQKVKDPGNANLNAMDNLDAIETDPGAKTPDLSKVSGGGVYIVNGNAKGNMCFGSIEWSGAGDKVDEGFAFPSDAEASSYEMIQNGQINRVFSPHSGYAWTAYCPDWADGGATLAQIDEYYNGRIKLYGSEDPYKGENADSESTFIEEGAYVYTIFAKEPAEGEDPAIDKELDMTNGSMTIEFQTDGIPAYPAIIKLMIRDANGDWYLGSAPDEEELPPEEELELEDEPFPANSKLVSAFTAEESDSFEVKLADLSWEQVGSDLADLLNSAEGYRSWEGSPFGMVIDPESTSVDLSAVTGGGLLINASVKRDDLLVIKGVKWEGDDTVDETFAGTAWRALVGWKQNAKLQISPATGYFWGAYMPLVEETNSVVINNQINIQEGGNVSGTYVYTIFAECEPVADDEYAVNLTEDPKAVDMSGGTLTVDLTVLSPVGLKVLVRDADGNWFLGGLPQAEE
jgi:hypothetical protein